VPRHGTKDRQGRGNTTRFERERCRGAQAVWQPAN
jgi:hypothetical protein